MLILQKDAGVLRTGGRGCQLRRPTVSCKLPLVWSIVVVFGMYFSSLSRELHLRHTDSRHRSRLSFSWTACISSIRRNNTISFSSLVRSGVSFGLAVRRGAIGDDNS